MKFIEELKKRNVIKTVGIYSAAALVIIQVAEIVFPRLFLPDWTVTFIIVLVIIGFPVTFILSWTYNLDSNSSVSSVPLENGFHLTVATFHSKASLYQDTKFGP